jgi:hypothetical protein
MKYAIEMGSGAMIYITGFINICSGIQKLVRGGGIDGDTQHNDFMRLLLFFFKYGKWANIWGIICRGILNEDVLRMKIKGMVIRKKKIRKSELFLSFKYEGTKYRVVLNYCRGFCGL